MLTGFRDLEVVDLDTIDVSNLNRQFLFRPAHVGRPKSTCAAEVVSAMAPGVRIVAHYGNIKTPEFGVPFVAGFDLVFNALDNVDARRHVNRLCLAASRPLLEAGTAGYLGQAYAIVKGSTECLECNPIPPPRTFPICTIRSTPDRPVHAVTWAQELFKLLFGDAPTSYLYEGGEISGGGEGGGSGGGGGGSSSSSAAAGSAYMAVVAALPPVGAPGAQFTAYAAAVFQALFHDDLQRRLEVAPDAFKGAKVPPTPLDLAIALAGGYGGGTEGSGGGGCGGAQLRDQRTLSVTESARLFLDTLVALSGDAAARATFGAREFSKDHPLDLDFVTAATNLRAAMFAIPLQSRWEVKSIAGNIVPAIATTNAAVAGLQVLEALKLLRGAAAAGSGGAGEAVSAAASAHGRYTTVMRVPSSGMRASLLLAVAAARPNARCVTCGTPSLLVRLDVRATTLGALLAGLVKAPRAAGGLGFASPQCDNGGGFLFCEENLDEEDEEEWAAAQARFLATPLADLPGGGVRNGTVLALSEFAPGAPREELSLTVLHREGPGWAVEGVRGAMPPPPPPPPPPPAAKAGKRGREDAGAGGDEDVVEVLEEGGEERGGGGGDAKRAKLEEGAGEADEDLVVLDE